MGKWITALILGTLALTGPARADTVSPLWQSLSGSPDYTTFVKALDEAGLDDRLKHATDRQPVTVFAPTNAAFEALDATSRTKLFSPANRDRLRDVLNLHMVSGEVAPFRAVEQRDLGSDQGQSLKVTDDKGQLHVNGVSAVPIRHFKTGYLYRLDRVLMPRQ
ncbi:fasciclin domain-containing protein [Larsenimonas rhizosphaerae]|uniref:Fasciclin domain-containing protein n=1 Tax=Larsenimonas rhizosphaerae TaxID=2944682 RepID=A0AA42CYA7_9GAMM|nr:fasciclin domain-containing protein [Larsenimonas rhizosphaerae]MCM2131758.1 fasciclin domain-containing protein [Larsenimonas rhizosphaerae]MCX2524915.1 fasciclin domain-containing protein [Larsenimonas rhizosphaerae]